MIEWNPKDEFPEGFKIESNPDCRNIKIECQSCKWISVNDRLPIPGECVLFYGRHELQMQPRIYMARYFNENDEGVWDENGYDILDYTHWMPLPEPPKVE